MNTPDRPALRRQHSRKTIMTPWEAKYLELACLPPGDRARAINIRTIKSGVVAIVVTVAPVLFKWLG